MDTSSSGSSNSKSQTSWDYCIKMILKRPFCHDSSSSSSVSRVSTKGGKSTIKRRLKSTESQHVRNSSTQGDTIRPYIPQTTESTVFEAARERRKESGS